MSAELAKKKRAVVLGAGPAGLSAAMGLVESGDYEVHVYQMGWRAGGKCATGRDSEHFRTRQNGSHYLFGCYHNAFALVRRAHQVLNASNAPDKELYGSFFGDFVARNLLVGAQGFDRLAISPKADEGFWYRYLPQNMACPGEGGKFATPFDYAFMLTQLGIGSLIDVYVAIVGNDTAEEPFDGTRMFVQCLPVSPFETSTWSKVLRALLTGPRWAFNAIFGVIIWFIKALVYAWGVVMPLWATDAVVNWVKDATITFVSVLRSMGREAEAAAERETHSISNGMLRLVILGELMLAGIVGFVSDELWRAGSFEKIDDEDLRDWLARHGASKLAYDSSLVRTWYDATICYKDGDEEQAHCSAGVAIQAMLRSLMTYKGAFAFQMRAEVGDSYIAPVVKALELLGVRFHFYHRVTELRVSATSRAVESISLTRQIPNPPSEAEFLDIQFGPKDARQSRKGWPSVALQASAVGHDFALDSYYSTLGHDKLELSRDTDFDVVVSALPLGVMQDVLVDSSRGALQNVAGPWQDLFRNVHLTESQALRMWLNSPLEELGWTHEPPILSGTSWPHSTWEDNSQSVKIQDFPETQTPQTIATLFGALKTGDRDVRDPSHYAAQLLVAQASAKRFLDVALAKLWPNLKKGDDIDWQKFIDLDNRSGRDRFDWQLVSANVGPNESYIVTLPGTLKYRPRPDESGFQHLYLAGDWTRNGVQAGTVEGAVISGLKAAHAITGKGQDIVGGNDFDYGTVFS